MLLIGEKEKAVRSRSFLKQTALRF